MSSTTRSRARSRARRVEATQRVLDAVTELMSDGTPYTDLPVQLIAERAALPRSTFYLHFPDKGHLLLALADDAIEDILDALQEFRAARPDDPESMVGPAERIIKAYRQNLRVLAAVREVAAYDAEVDAHWRERFETVVSDFAEQLVAQQERGVLSEAAEPAALPRLGSAMIDRTIANHCQSDPEGKGDERLARALGRAAWLVIYGDSPARWHAAEPR